MAYTKFGEFMRIQRIKHHEVMGDSAKLFDVSMPFISAVENGKRNVPDGWFDILVSHYNLTTQESDELSNAIEQSKTQVKLNLTRTTAIRREMAIQLQRSFDTMDEDTAETILKFLKDRKED